MAASSSPGDGTHSAPIRVGAVTASPLWSRPALRDLLVGGGVWTSGLLLATCLTDLPFQDMENKIRSTLNEIYFGKTKDIVNGLR